MILQTWKPNFGVEVLHPAEVAAERLRLGQAVFVQQAESASAVELGDARQRLWYRLIAHDCHASCHGWPLYGSIDACVPRKRRVRVDLEQQGLARSVHLRTTGSPSIFRQVS